MTEKKRLLLLEGSLICEGHKVRGYAIHPMATYHPKEWPTVRRYIEPYLIRAAPTAAGKPFLIDHEKKLSPENHATLGRWDAEKNAVYYEGEVSDDIAEKIRLNKIKSVSVGLDFQRPGSGILVTERGVIPYAYGLEEISFLQDMDPGDPEATVQLWEGILKESGEQDFIMYLIQSLDIFLLNDMQVLWLDQDKGIQAIYGRLKERPESLQPFAYLFMKAREWDDNKIQAWLTDHPQYAKSAQTPQPTSIIEAGATGQYSLVCPSCHKTFKSETMEPLKCPLCGQNFTRKQELKVTEAEQKRVGLNHLRRRYDEHS